MTMLRLLPVIELTPGAIARRYAGERACPTTDAPNEAWDAWFLACLRDGGIEGLRPFRSRGWWIATEQWTAPATIERLVEAHVDEAPTLSAAVAAPALWHCFAGGFVLFDDERILVEPSCCVDLGNLEEWRAALAATDGEWRMLWVGHPWHFTRRDGSTLQISPRTEANEPTSLAVEHTVDAAQLAVAIERAQDEVDRFTERLRAVLARHTSDPAIATQLAQILVAAATPDETP